MLLDANAWLGHYPFRQVPHTTPEGLLGLMDKHQIETAVVSSLHAVSRSLRFISKTTLWGA